MIINPKYQSFEKIRQIGEHQIILPDPPNLNKIAYKDLPKQDQFFRRTYLPDNWKFMMADERRSFAKEEWRKRNEGFWYWNNGNLEFMIGPHYFYANWWRIDKAEIPKEYIIDSRDYNYPFNVDADRDWFYLAEHCFNDDRCCGFLNIEGRRAGKTFRVISYQYEKISKTKDSQGGIQSRNDNDAKRVFGKVVFGWRNLPAFFKPTDTGETNPASVILFDEPRSRNTKNQNKEYSEVLHSWIDYANAKEGAYDGMPQLVNIQDEFAKVEAKEGIDMLERFRVVRECVMKGTTVVGKIIATSTVEEMEKRGGQQAKELWDRSTISDFEAKALPNLYKTAKARDENGFTLTGLYRYFKPSYRGLWGRDADKTPFIDRYGYSQEERARGYLERRRKAKSGSDLASEKRKYPVVVKDCWVSDSKKALYDTVRIEQQMEWNDANVVEGRDLVRGNFIWKVKNLEAEWHPDPNGKWLVAWLQKAELRNKKISLYGKIAPANTDTGCFGLDPYDNKTTVDNRKSDAACYGIRKFDPLNPYETGIPILEYVGRPPAPEIMWEDMIIMSVFYGWEILIEKNKIGTINWFRTRGFQNYLMKRPEETETFNSLKADPQDKHGIDMSGEEARIALIHAIESFVYNRVGLIQREDDEPYMGKCYFNKLLQQLLDFDFDQKWTQFDCMVGFGLALLAARKYIPKRIERKPTMFFQTYKMEGSTSVPVNEKDYQGIQVKDGKRFWNGMEII